MDIGAGPLHTTNGAERATHNTMLCTQTQMAEATGEHLDLVENGSSGEGENSEGYEGIARVVAVCGWQLARAHGCTPPATRYTYPSCAYFDRVSGTRRSQHRYPNWNVRKSRRVLAMAMRCGSVHSSV